MPKLNLGCRTDHKAGFINVDRVPPADVITDLRNLWPWGDSEVDYIYAKDIFEHLDNQEFPQQQGMIWCMNESHRVLCPGGRLELIVPCLPGVAPWVDPTHVSVWTSGNRYYFDERWNDDRNERGLYGPGMGVTALFKSLPNCRSGVDWNPIAYAADDPERHKLFLLLEAVK